MTPLDPQRLGHVGIVVADLDDAMARLGALLGLRWSPVQEWEVEATGPGGTAVVPVRLTWSLEGPVHTELLAGATGSVWHIDEGETLHHLGYWADDVDEASSALTAAGCPLELVGTGRASRANRFAYHRAPSGIRVEVLTAAQRAPMERWLDQLRRQANR